MTAASKRPPPLFIGACILFAAGAVGLFLALILPLERYNIRVLLYISIALMGFGTGEIINHPKERLPDPESSASSTRLQTFRRRNVCSLGNLCDIFALLIFFIGIATMLYRR